MTDLVEVVIQVPSDRIADLYAAVAQLLRTQPVSATPQSQMNDEPRDWHQGDEGEAKQVMSKCSPNAQKILSYLANHPDQPILGSQIAKDLGMEGGHQSVAGSLSSVGINCGRVHRRMPLKLSYAEGATAAHYIMPEEVAAMFRAA